MGIVLSSQPKQAAEAKIISVKRGFLKQREYQKSRN